MFRLLLCSARIPHVKSNKLDNKPAPDGAGVREGVRKMDNQQIKETLDKQLQLLSERSAVALSENNLAEISKVILDIAVNLWKINDGRRPY